MYQLIVINKIQVTIMEFYFSSFYSHNFSPSTTPTLLHTCFKINSNDRWVCDSQMTGFNKIDIIIKLFINEEKTINHN